MARSIWGECGCGVDIQTQSFLHPSSVFSLFFGEPMSLSEQKPLMRVLSEEGPRCNMSERELNEWIDEARNTLEDRGYEYGDPRSNLLRIYKIARELGVQLRDPSDVAIVFIATKLSRMVASPMREDSYLDLIGYSGILALCRFSTPEDWDDIELKSQP